MIIKCCNSRNNVDPYSTDEDENNELDCDDINEERVLSRKNQSKTPFLITTINSNSVEGEAI